MKCPEFILEIINRYEYPEVDHFEWKLFLKSLYRMLRGARPIFATRMFLQRTFRKNHLSDLNIWDTTSYMARDCLKRLRAFKAYERQGYPSDFCASHSDYSCSPEDYQRHIEEGSIIGGGPERWEITIDHIIMALEYVAYVGDEMYTKRAHEWWVKHFGFSPHDEIDVNHDDRWVKKEDLKDGINVGISQNPNNPEYEHTVHYTNYELMRYADSVVRAGLINMAIYWQNLWD